MASYIEIIPTVLLDLPTLYNKAGKVSDINIYSVVNEKEPETSQIENGLGYTIKFRNKSFYIRGRSSKEDFDIEPAISYLEEQRTNLIDIEELAFNWQEVGCSYFIAPDGEYEDLDFVSLVLLVAEASKGIILNIDNIWPWSKGLATTDELKKRSKILK